MAMSTIILLISASGISALAALPTETAEVHPAAFQGNSQPSNPTTVIEQPIAAESSYGKSYSSYAPRSNSYSAPKYDSYSSPKYDSYSEPYITGSCYGQYPGVTGNTNYDCKSYSVCQADGRLDILYCPPYTRFNNYLGVCDWHFKVDSYCNPLYKEEYHSNSYDNKQSSNGYEAPKQSYGYEAPKQSYGYEAPKQNYGYEAPKQNYGYEAPKQNYGYEAPKQNYGYEAPKQNYGYEAPKSNYGYEKSSYEAPSSYGYEQKTYEAPSYGHRSVYPQSKKY